MDDLAKADWSNPERVQNLTESYGRRYGDDFWATFFDIIRISRPTVVADFGCGPGLFLLDSVKKLGAKRVFGLDASQEMLSQAEEFLRSALSKEKIWLKEIDFNEDPLELEANVINLAFSGYVIHELDDPLNLLEQIRNSVEPGGEYIILDFISGDPEGFVNAMIQNGMKESEAKARYPHMCKNSLQDLQNILSAAGFDEILHNKIESFRAILSGIKRDESD